jgi:hypothetical protein
MDRRNIHRDLPRLRFACFIEEREERMEYKICPHCGTQFLCQPDNPTQCQCAGIVLSDANRSYIAEHYPSRCLCAKCLKQLAK